MLDYTEAHDVLAASITNAIQDCKKKFGRINYELCMDLWERHHVEKLFEEYAVGYFIGRTAAGYTYENASIKIDGHRFFLEQIYNEVRH